MNLTILFMLLVMAVAVAVLLVGLVMVVVRLVRRSSTHARAEESGTSSGARLGR